MSLIRSLFSRALGPLTRIPLVSPKAMLIGARALGTIPAVLFLYHSIQYYADFLQTQSPQFYDPFHYEVYDFIVGKEVEALKRWIKLNWSKLIVFLGSGWRVGGSCCCESPFKEQSGSAPRARRRSESIVLHSSLGFDSPASQFHGSHVRNCSAELLLPCSQESCEPALRAS